MKDFLIKLKIIDYLTTDLKTSKKEFIERLSAATDKGDTGMFSGGFDAFSSSKNEFKGQVNYDGFKLKRRRRFFDNNMNTAVATGSLYEHNGHLTVETEINGFNNFFIVFYLFIIVFYSIFIINLVSGGGVSSFTIPFLILHASLMFSLPYFMMRRSVKRLKYELEREFFYLTKEK